MRPHSIAPRMFSTLAFLTTLGAQEPQMHGPVSGVVYDAVSQSIRPILGLPGGAHLGPPTYSGLDYASVAPNGDLALAVIKGRVLLIRGLFEQPSASIIEGAIANPDRILWAKDSSAALLSSAEGAGVQRLSNLRDTPRVDDPISLPPEAGSLSTVAADGSARRVVAGMRGASGGGVYLISEYGNVSLLAAIGDPTAVAFTPDGQDVYVADGASNQIFAIRSIAEGASVALALDSRAGVFDPIGLAVTSAQLFVVSRAQRTVRAYSLPALTPVSESQLDEEPQGIEPIPSSSLYRLTARRKLEDVLLLIDAGAGTPAFFVPAGE